ncbi:MAG: ATP synthase F0 subunit B [Acidobacteria bacterium]|nr:ATP synthase F0 subunit B [Acidobacteriota bacterium]
MEETLGALGGLMLKALPTFVLLLILHFYLKKFFFAPLDKVLAERHAATEGARSQAEKSLQQAARKTAEYEAALRDARAAIYKDQETSRKAWRDEQATAIGVARSEAMAAIQTARAGIAAETEAARATLTAQAEALADSISGSILKGRVQ